MSKTNIFFEAVNIDALKMNEDNPRFITDNKFDLLKKSLTDFPQMLELRPIVVDENNVVLGGNMRLRAALAIGLKTVPVVRTKNLTAQQKKEFIIKDNVGFGQWDYDLLGNWDKELLTDWALDTWAGSDFDVDGFFEDNNNDDAVKTNKIVLEYTDDDYVLVQEKLAALNGSKEQIIFNLLVGE